MIFGITFGICKLNNLRIRATKKHMKKVFLVLSCFIFFIALKESGAQVSANFSSNVTSGCGSLQVSFSDQSSSSSGNITSWSWNLGGVSSSSQNPGRIFGTPGSYTICLTVTDSGGNSDTECKQDYITVFNLPLPEFEALPSLGCIPLDVVFEDQSVSGGGNITEWIWGLGGSAGVIVDDGSAPEITSTYSTPDDYTITLTLKDENGCSNTLTKNNYVQVVDIPELNILVDQTFTCTAPLVVNFSNLSDTQDMEFFWDFGNSTTYNGVNPPPIVYNQQGAYTVTVIGNNLVTGCSDTLILVDHINVGYPINFSYTPESGCEDLVVSFFDNSADPADSLVWNFGDGMTSTVNNPTYTYVNPGCYYVKLIRYVNGCVSQALTQNCIEVFALPDVSYSNNKPLGCSVPHTVKFTGASSDAVSWAWDFGDGNTSNVKNPTHTYTALGFYNVSLTVTNANGCTNTISTDQIGIQEIQASIPSGQTQGCTPLSVLLNDNSSSITPIIDWQWEVYDSYSTPPASYFTFTGQDPSFNLIDTGLYTVSLIVTNDIGCVDTTVFDQVIAVGIPPDVDFDADPKENCVETEIAFIDLSSSFANSFLWDFGDGATSDLRNPVHEYAGIGLFDITLTAWHHGCINFSTKTDFIQINPPKARFDIIRDCETPYFIQLQDDSEGADSIHWDFGVPGTMTDESTDWNPSYTYATTGTYTVTQEVFNFTYDCSDDQTYTIIITDPLADFTLSTLTGCEPLTVSTIDNSLFANQYSWTAPGGIISNPQAAEPTIVYNNTGTFTDIELIITDINGCKDTLLNTDTIYVNGINPDFTYNPNGGCRPLIVDAVDNSTTVYGNINAWSWNFGGLGSSNDQNPTFTFGEIGIFPITLSVSNDWGCNEVITINNAVEVTYPYPQFDSETYSCTDHAVSFNNHSVGTLMTYLWDFGDGNTSTQISPTHLYINEGSYTVCLTATDKYGCDSTLCKTDYILIANPVAAFSADTTDATCPPLFVNFQNSSLYANIFQWDFGDNGGTSTLFNPPHIYTEPGNFDVTLIASTNEFCSDTLTLVDYINIGGPIGSFSFDIDSACIPATITFIGESLDPYTFVWDYGNGVLDSTLNVSNDTISYVYNEIGSFIPQLVLIDDANCIRAFESPDTLRLEVLDLDFFATDQILCTGESSTSFLNITNSSSPINYLEWNFENGNPNTSNNFEPTVNYTNAGLNDVMLIAENGFCRDTLFRPDYIKIGESPVADFIMSGNLGCEPYTVSFSDMSTITSGVIDAWEWNFEDGGNSILQNPTYIFNETGIQDIEFIVSTDIGCTDTLVNTIEVHPMPTVELTGSDELCMGQTAQLNAEITSDPTGVTYHWINDPTLNCTDCFDPIVNPLDTTTYYFVINNLIGCTDTFAITVVVRPYPAPVLTMTEDTTICKNDVLQINVNGGPDIYTYEWNNSGSGLSCNNCPDPIASPTELTSYQVTVTNQWDCSTEGGLIVDVLDEYQPFAGEDKTICEGDNTQLDISFGNNPIWLVTDGLDCWDCPNPVSSPISTTEYFVEVTTDYGCKLIDTVVVNIVYPEDVDAGGDALICDGESVQLLGVAEGNISWSPSFDLNNSNILNPIGNPSSSVTYYMTATNGDCILTDSMEVEVIDKAEIFVDDVKICEGEGIQLQAYGNADSYFWYESPDLSDIYIPNPIAQPNETTTYTVVGEIGMCESDTAIVEVTVVPELETFIPEYYQYFNGQTVQLNLSITNPDDYLYQWFPAELLNCTNCINPSFTPDTTMTYTVEITDPSTGCVTIESTIVKEYFSCPTELIGVPNIFTPNNDGINDILKMELSPSMSEIYTFKVFNRWGALVFETEDFNEGWDGTYKGEIMPNGVYIYFLEAPCEVNGRRMIKKGDITIIR